MLTPNQIRNHVFSSSKGAYPVAEVDSFMGEIIASYEQMFRENGELLGKLEMLAGKIEEYRQDEDKIKDALIVAQKAASQITREAQETANNAVSQATARAEELTNSSQQEAQTLLTDANNQAAATLSKAEATANEVIDGAKVLADNVISQAKSSSEEIIATAKIEVEKNQTILNDMKAAAASFKADLLEHYHKHIEVINEIPDRVAKELEERIQNQMEAAKPEIIAEEPAWQEDVAEAVDATEEASLEAADNQDQTEQWPSVTEPAAEAQPRQEMTQDAAPVYEEPSWNPPAEAYQEEPAWNPPAEAEQDEPAWAAVQEAALEEPVRHAGIPPVREEELKFGEDYDISDDTDDYDDDDGEERGFRGFFRRKK